MPKLLKPPIQPGDGDPRHGGNGGGYSNHGCRCDECKAAHTRRTGQRRRERARELAAGLYPVLHGEHSTYVNSGCRCRACTEANAEAQRRHRA